MLNNQSVIEYSIPKADTELILIYKALLVPNL